MLLLKGFAWYKKLFSFTNCNNLNPIFYQALYFPISPSLDLLDESTSNFAPNVCVYAYTVYNLKDYRMVYMNLSGIQM